MIETMKSMILSVTAAAIFSAVMLQLTQKSALREIVKLATGMVMILALLTPLTRLRMPSISGWFSRAQQSVSTQTTQAQEQNERLAHSSIASAISRYIQGQATDMGAVCGVRTTLATEADGTARIASVSVSGKLTPQQRDALAGRIEQDCGVLREDISFTEE